MAFLAALAIAGATVLAGAAPAAAVTEAAPGAPCDSDDLGRRVGWQDTMNISPEITHFTAYYVTAGTTGTQTVQLTYQQQLTVAVLQEVSISTGFGVPFLTKLDINAKFAVTKTTMSTSIEQHTMVWNFTQPGYYAVYKGMHEVSGQMSALQCQRLQLADGSWALQWQRRAVGGYTTWGRNQEGAIRCEDPVPPNTVMRLAQDWLGCTGQPAPRVRPAAEPQESKGPAVSAGAVPSGYACDPGYYFITSRDGLLLDEDDERDGAYAGWTSGSGNSIEWRLCNGPADAAGNRPSVLVNRTNGKCLGVTPDATVTDRALMELRSCEGVPSRQKLYLYRDVPGSDLVGIQLAYRGAMLGADEMIEGAPALQLEGGMPDGSGTFRLLPA